jgi:hypothetical protein
MPEPQVRLSHREDADMERASMLNLLAYRNRMRDLQASEPVDIAERECNELVSPCPNRKTHANPNPKRGLTQSPRTLKRNHHSNPRKER